MGPVVVLLCLCFGSTAILSQSSGDLFNPQVLHRVDLLLHSQDWVKLKQNFRSNEYYPADVTWNGITVRNTGIRSRGFGSRSETKPGLRVDFDRYATDQSFLGLKSFVLDNLTQDPSGVHETVAMWLFSRLNIPAPRTAHTVLYVNGAYAGVYSVIESIDKAMLARVFGSVGDDVQNDGYLYEYNKVIEWRLDYLGSDLEPYKSLFSAKTHESKSDEILYRPLETLVRLINETPASELKSALGPHLDLAGLVRYVAAQNFIGENDGFLGEWGMNNFYLYRIENRDQHVIIAWDDDMTFWGGPTYDVVGFHGGNVLMAKLMQVPEYRELYFRTLLEAADAATEVLPNGLGALENEIRRQLDLVDGPMRSDPLKPWTETDFQTEADLLRQYSTPRALYVRCEVARLTGASSRACS